MHTDIVILVLDTDIPSLQYIAWRAIMNKKLNYVLDSVRVWQAASGTCSITLRIRTKSGMKVEWSARATSPASAA